jgi:phenylalanyl-tRNA synthetase beta subunit
MLLSYNWLKQLVNLKESPEKLAELLTMHVANVENIKKIGENLDKVIVAEIVDIKPHPNADKLKIAKVKTKVNNQIKILNIVCGAPNIKVGQKVPLALVGCKLPNGVEIKEVVIRGVKSEGMLCAEDELNIGEDHTGIFILPKEAKIGEPLNKTLGLSDTIFEIENKSITHRPDLFSHLGFAQEILAITNSEPSPYFKKLLKIEKKSFKTKKLLNLKINIENLFLCPRYMAVIIDKVKIKPSPLWLRNYLQANQIRSINNIVDITNFVMAELGQPLHAFDYEKIFNKKTNLATIEIRKAKEGERLLALDGKEYELTKDDLVIANDEKPIALAGIIGGELSSVNSNTKTIVIESANFNPYVIRKTSRRLNLKTESSIRFEKGLPVNFPEMGIKRAIELIQELADGEVISEIYDLKDELTKIKLSSRRKIFVEFEKINKIIGQSINEKRIISILKKLGFRIKKINLIKTLIKIAKKQVGKPYKYGASTFKEGGKFFDCSSLTRWLYRQIGIELPRISIKQAEVGMDVDLSSLKPGDLIFSKGRKPYFNEKFPNGIGHVGMYLGSNKIIHSSYKKKKVVISNLKEFAPKKELRAFKRIILNQIGTIAEVPIFRPDINFLEDLVEEIVRIDGVNKIKPKPILSELIPVEYERNFVLERNIREILVGFGFDEVYNYSFTSEANPNSIEIINPLNIEQKYLRTNLLVNLKKNAEKNSNYFDEFKIFEIGKVFYWKDNEAKQNKHLAGLIFLKKEKNLYFKVKGILEGLFERLNVNSVVFKPVHDNYIYQTQIELNDQLIGFFGIDLLEQQKQIGVFEIDLSKFEGLFEKVKLYQKISPYPPIKRDLAFLVEKKVKWEEIKKVLENLNPLIKKIELFDVYEDEKFKGRRNIAFHVVYQSDKKTLTSEEVDEIQKEIIKILKEKFDADLRGL